MNNQTNQVLNLQGMSTANNTNGLLECKRGGNQYSGICWNKIKGIFF